MPAGDPLTSRLRSYGVAGNPLSVSQMERRNKIGFGVEDALPSCTVCLPSR